MQAKKYLEELMRFHEEKEAKEDKARKSLGRFIREKNINSFGEKNKIDLFFM